VSSGGAKDYAKDCAKDYAKACAKHGAKDCATDCANEGRAHRKGARTAAASTPIGPRARL
jgi:hypothetical protein